MVTAQDRSYPVTWDRRRKPPLPVGQVGRNDGSPLLSGEVTTKAGGWADSSAAPPACSQICPLKHTAQQADLHSCPPSHKSITPTNPQPDPDTLRGSHWSGPAHYKARSLSPTFSCLLGEQARRQKPVPTLARVLTPHTCLEGFAPDLRRERRD